MVPAEAARAVTRPNPSIAPAPPAGQRSGEAFPRMRLEVHVYAESPADRMVFINGRKYVVGEKVEDKYLFERITEDGVILAYQGERLRLSP
jgi:Type II secretion system protein B